MWEPRRLTTLWALTACDIDSLNRPLVDREKDGTDCLEKMWEPRRLTTLWALTACDIDSLNRPLVDREKDGRLTVKWIGIRCHISFYT
jgi:starvation-inducible outer membrane lipoprotein